MVIFSFIGTILGVLARIQRALFPPKINVPKKLVRTHGDDVRFSRHFINRRDRILFVHKWLAGGVLSRRDQVQLDKVKGVIFLVHGFDDSLVRYNHVAEYLNLNFFDVYGIDHQGHGLSEGRRAFIHDFDDLVVDYEDFIKHIRDNELPERHKTLPKILIGHSMGGLIAVHLASRNSSLFQKIVLSSPALQLKPISSIELLIVKTICYFFPNFPVESINPLEISRDVMVLQRNAREFVLSHRPVRCNSALQIMKGIEQAHIMCPKIKTPFLIVHGSEDKLCLPSGSQEFYARACSTAENKKAMLLYTGLQHELFREESWEKPLLDIVNWIMDRP